MRNLGNVKSPYKVQDNIAPNPLDVLKNDRELNSLELWK